MDVHGMTLELEAAVDLVVRRSRHERLRELVREHPEHYGPGVLRLARQLAAEADPGPAPEPSGPFPGAAPPRDGRIRVGLGCPLLAHGGAERWMSTLAESLDRARFALAGVAVQSPVSEPAVLARFAERMPVGTGPHALARLAARCDVLVIWGLTGIGAALDGLAARPVVVAVSHSDHNSPWAMQLWTDPTGIDRFVAVSEAALAPVPAPHRADATVIWNCVDAPRMVARRSRDAMHRAWGVPPGARVVGTLCRLDRDKDPLAIARAVACLPEPWHAVLVGAGWDRDALAEASRGVPRFHLVGGDPDAGSVLAAFDVLVAASHYESFGLSVCEGFWSGVPVLATEVGIAAMVPGLVRVIPQDPAGPDLAAAIRDEQDHPEATRARVARAQAFARARLAPERFGAEWGGFLARVAGARTTGRPDPFPAPSPSGPTPIQRVAACPHRKPWASCWRRAQCHREADPDDPADPGLYRVIDQCLACVGQGVSSEPATP